MLRVCMGFLSQFMQKPIMTIAHQHNCNQSPNDGKQPTVEMSGKSNASHIMDSAKHNKRNELTTVTNLQRINASKYFWNLLDSLHDSIYRYMLEICWINCSTVIVWMHSSLTTRIHLSLLQWAHVSTYFKCACASVHLTKYSPLTKKQGFTSIHNNCVEVCFPVTMRLIWLQAGK
jgi:hypothetical protein